MKENTTILDQAMPFPMLQVLRIYNMLFHEMHPWNNQFKHNLCHDLGKIYVLKLITKPALLWNNGAFTIERFFSIINKPDIGYLVSIIPISIFQTKYSFTIKSRTSQKQII